MKSQNLDILKINEPDGLLTKCVWLYILPKLWVNINFPKGIISSSVKESKAAQYCHVTHSYEIQGLLFQFLYSSSPHPLQGVLLFQAFPCEIKIEMPESLNSAVRSQIPVQFHQKKKGRGKEARNPREEWIDINIFIDFLSPKIPVCQ